MSSRPGIQSTGWDKYSIWSHSSTVRELYRRRVNLEEEEMTCAAQAAELLQPLLSGEQRESLLDIACGTGYFFHSLRSRSLAVDYYGIDACAKFIEIGRECLSKFDLPADRLKVMRVEDLEASVDHVVCMNFLSNIDNYHRPLERVLKSARKSVIIRESCADKESCLYVEDKYLDDDVSLKVYVHTYPVDEFVEFIESYGFEVRMVTDRRTQGEPEMVIDHPHHWQYFVAVKNEMSA